MRTYLFLGDSITDCNHYFDPEALGFGYVRMIHETLSKAQMPPQIINKGNDGSTVSSVRRVWKNFCTELSPDLITILIGINDLSVIFENQLTLSVALSEFRSRYEALIADIRQTTSCPILLMETFVFPHPAYFASWKSPLAQMNQIISHLAKENNLYFLPLWESLTAAAKTYGYSALTTDGIHLTPQGHELIATRWLTQLQTVLPH